MQVKDIPEPPFYSPNAPVNDGRVSILYLMILRLNYSMRKIFLIITPGYYFSLVLKHLYPICQFLPSKLIQNRWGGGGNIQFLAQSKNLIKHSEFLSHYHSRLLLLFVWHSLHCK